MRNKNICCNVSNYQSLTWCCNWRSRIRITLLSNFLFLDFQGYISSGVPQAALALYNEMLNLELKPDKLTYNTLISACVKINKLDAAMYFFEEMKVTNMY